MDDKGILYDKKTYTFLKSTCNLSQNHSRFILKRRKNRTEKFNNCNPALMFVNLWR